MSSGRWQRRGDGDELGQQGLAMAPDAPLQITDLGRAVLADLDRMSSEPADSSRVEDDD